MGFPASPLLVGSIGRLDERSRAKLAELVEQATHPGARVRRPGVALALGIVDDRREGLVLRRRLRRRSRHARRRFVQRCRPRQNAGRLGRTADREQRSASTCTRSGRIRRGTSPSARVDSPSRLDLPDDPDDTRWAHLLIEAATAAGFDRPAVLHDDADGRALLAEIDTRFALIDRERASSRSAPADDGDTTYLCTAGRDRRGRRMGVSLIQSNASGFGSHLVEPTTGINLHNRGIGFSLEPGHPGRALPRSPPAAHAVARTCQLGGSWRRVRHDGR